MENKDLAEKLSVLFPKYENLGKNLVQALKLLLDKNNIKYVSVYHRVKELTSFIEKIERKEYRDPLSEIEDICGIRIICYYQSDISNISKIINNEFKIFESENKEGKLNEDQFGYRSLHFIATIKEDWTKVPNYSELNGLKAEIQVRTILMHAWAEIEHNLAYKAEAHIPGKFKRKLFRLSAKLEEADEQFEDLKRESKAHQAELLEKANDKSLQFTNTTPINLDTLQAFLNYYFPDRKKDLDATSTLLDEILKHNFKFGDIVKAYDKLKPHIPKMEEENFKNSVYSKWAQVGIIRIIMKIMNEEYANSKSVSSIASVFRKKYYLNKA